MTNTTTSKARIVWADGFWRIKRDDDFVRVDTLNSDPIAFRWVDEADAFAAKLNKEAGA